MNQITHRPDPETGHLRQIVSASELRAVLDRSGDSYERPRDFSPEDEWHVEEDERDA